MRSALFACLVLPLALASCQKIDPLFCGSHPTDQRCSDLGDGGVGDGGGVTIGGTVSGLMGAGLILTNNGGDDKSVSSPGPFNFATQIASGSPYDVEIEQQPSNPTQVCTATNNTGTANGDVSSVTVSCTTPTFNVGVKVLGLTSGTLVLTDNGGDDLSLTASGTYMFATKLASGSMYMVAIKSGPSTCSVGGGSGTVGSSDVSTIVVNCAPGQFTIGGKVAGLDGKVTLHEATGNDDVTPTADGDFAFPNTVAQGGNYTVTVTVQPTAPPVSQTCTVSNGSGSNLQGNISGIAVNCVTNSFTVGGNATGVNGTVVLQDNGGDNLSLTSSTGFTFPGKIASGKTYAVTVYQEPNTLSCTVNNGSSTMQNANVTNVGVACSYRDPGIKCGGSECAAGSQQCCDPEGGGGASCQAARSRCGSIVLGCDSAADCGGSVCCAYEDKHGNSLGSVCTNNCFGRVAAMCDPMAGNPCPTGGTCRSYGALSGYYTCQ